MTDSISEITVVLDDGPEMGLLPGALHSRVAPNIADIDIYGLWQNLLLLSLRVVSIRLRNPQTNRFDFVGSGFLVGPRHILTNRHVVETGKYQAGLLRKLVDCNDLEIGYTRLATSKLDYDGIMKVDRIIQDSPAADNEYRTAGGAAKPDKATLDFALLELRGAISGNGRGWWGLPQDRPNLVQNSPLVIAFQKGGRIVFAINTNPGLAYSDDGARLQYANNTIPGSSGGLVLSYNNFAPVALHQFGNSIAAGKQGGSNHGIPLHLVREAVLNNLTVDVPPPFSPDAPEIGRLDDRMPYFYKRAHDVLHQVASDIRQDEFRDDILFKSNSENLDFAVNNYKECLDAWKSLIGDLHQEFGPALGGRDTHLANNISRILGWIEDAAQAVQTCRNAATEFCDCGYSRRSCDLNRQHALKNIIWQKVLTGAEQGMSTIDRRIDEYSKTKPPPLPSAAECHLQWGSLSLQFNQKLDDMKNLSGGPEIMARWLSEQLCSEMPRVMAVPAYGLDDPRSRLDILVRTILGTLPNTSVAAGLSREFETIHRDFTGYYRQTDSKLLAALK